MRRAVLVMLSIVFTFHGLAAQATLPLVPWPSSVQLDTGSFTPGPGTVIVPGAGVSRALAQYARELVEAETGLRLSAGHGPDIALKLEKAGAPEGYRLRVTSRGITISAAREAGLFYGLQTLRQLLADSARSVPAMRIEDAPRFAYRGLHLDVARHMFPVEFIKRYIDLMSRYKLNTFHWHLTDDQGWRLEIKRYPRLTSIGAWRKETILERNFDPYVGDGQRYGGFYTQAEVREVVRYAASRHVTVIPEIEMPGHAQAALAAYPSLGCTPGPFEVSTVWGVDDDIFCPSEGTFLFLRNVLTEVMALFPSRYIHIGGDEAPKTRWKASRVAQAVIRRERLKNELELQSWFVRRIERFLAAHGRRLIGWDEILEGGLAPRATVMSWRGTDGGIAAARAGHDVIMTPTSHLYFDYAQAEPALEPLSIGADVPLSRVYQFEPVPSVLSAAQAKHVLGAQANVWTEYLKTPERVEFMVFPRLFALAEVVWSPKQARDWESFTTRLPAQLAALDRMDVNYRVPHVEGLGLDRISLADTAVVELRTLLPGAVQIRYTLDGSDPSATSALYTTPLRLALGAGDVAVKARAFMGERSSPVRGARFRRTTLRAAETVTAPLASGLLAAYHEAKLDSAKAAWPAAPTWTGAASSVALTGRERAETFGLQLTGYVRVPADAVYTFTLSSDDGSVLRIGDRVVVDHDGWHGDSERSGMVALAAGLHPIEVRMVQGGGGKALRGYVRREGEVREPLAGRWLAH